MEHDKGLIVVATRHTDQSARLTIRLASGRRTDIDYVSSADCLVALMAHGANAELLQMAADAIVKADRVFSF